MLADRYLAIIEALERADVRYVIAGGMAVNLHGHVRFTKDLDLMFDLAPDNTTRGMQALASCGLRSRLPVELSDFADTVKREDWFENRNMLVFQVWHPEDPFCSVDVFVNNPVAFEDLWSRSHIDTLGSVRCRFASIEDLVVMKRIAGRPQDLSDIEVLQQIETLRKERG